jgi:hypothetical protein
MKDQQALIVRHISIIRIAHPKKIWQSLRGLVTLISTSGLSQALWLNSLIEILSPDRGKVGICCHRG